MSKRSTPASDAGAKRREEKKEAREEGNGRDDDDDDEGVRVAFNPIGRLSERIDSTDEGAERIRRDLEGLAKRLDPELHRLARPGGGYDGDDAKLSDENGDRVWLPQPGCVAEDFRREAAYLGVGKLISKHNRLSRHLADLEASIERAIAAELEPALAGWIRRRPKDYARATAAMKRALETEKGPGGPRAFADFVDACVREGWIQLEAPIERAPPSKRERPAPRGESTGENDDAREDGDGDEEGDDDYEEGEDLEAASDGEEEEEEEEEEEDYEDALDFIAEEEDEEGEDALAEEAAMAEEEEEDDEEEEDE